MAETEAPGAPKKLTRAERRAARKERIKNKRLEANKKPRLFTVKKNGRHVCRFESFLHAVLGFLHMIFFPYRIHGNKKMDKGACIFVGNHYSMFDIFFPIRTTWDGIHYICKKSILEAPILWKWGKRIGAIGVARDGTDVRALMEAVRVLKAGDKLCMFPEGTRNRTEGDEFLPFQGGAAMLSVKTKAPIIPFVVMRRPRIFRITHVVFGEPIEFPEYYGRKVTPEEYEALDETLKNRMYELRDAFRASRKKGKK